MHTHTGYVQPIYTYLNTHEHYKLLLYKHRLVPMSKQILYNCTYRHKCVAASYNHQSIIQKNIVVVY